MWTLLLSRLTDPPGVYFDRRQLDAGEMKIGRSAKTCDIVLPNDDGLISREHCSIVASGLDLFVTDTSKNGVSLNDPAARIVPHQAVPVRPHDRLIINDFVITVVTAAEGAGIGLVAPPPPPIPGFDAPSGGGQDVWFDTPPADPIWQDGPDLGGGLGGGAVHDFLAGGNAFFDAPMGAEPPGRHPEDFGFSPGMGEAFVRPIMADPLPMGDFGIPEDWAATPMGGSAPDPFAAPPAPDAFGGADPFGGTDPFGGKDPFGGADPFAPPPPPGAFAAFDAPPPAATPAPAPVAGAAPAAGGADWAAFHEGAGLSPDELQLPPDAMYRLGVLYRQVVLGLCDILQDRAAFKDEFRVERTQLSIGKNNPLKHLPALDAAKVLIGKGLPGFMDTEEAVRTSFEDVKKHQMAMLAGVQRALLVAFDRLSPQEIEKFTEKAGAHKKGLLGRKPDTWAVYITVFEALKRDATSNANGVMSVAFREGYENFMKQLR